MDNDQLALFNRFKCLGYDVKNLGNIVQNDFDDLIKDGVTKKDILQSLSEFDKTIDKCIDDLKELKQQVRQCIYSKFNIKINYKDIIV